MNCYEKLPKLKSAARSLWLLFKWGLFCFKGVDIKGSSCSYLNHLVGVQGISVSTDAPNSLMPSWLTRSAKRNTSSHSPCVSMEMCAPSAPGALGIGGKNTFRGLCHLERLSLAEETAPKSAENSVNRGTFSCLRISWWQVKHTMIIKHLKMPK